MGRPYSKYNAATRLARKEEKTVCDGIFVTQYIIQYGFPLYHSQVRYGDTESTIPTLKRRSSQRNARLNVQLLGPKELCPTWLQWL